MNSTTSVISQDQDTSAGPSEPIKILYERIESKIHNKRFAPVGQLYLSIVHKTSRRKYSNTILVNGIGLTEEIKSEICKNLWKSLQEKYKL